MSFTHLFKVWTWKILSLCCYLTSFFFIYEYLQFSTMWILWDQKCEYGFFQITHAQDSSNYLLLTCDLTRFFGICNLEKPILTFLISQYSHCWKLQMCIQWEWVKLMYKLYKVLSKTHVHTLQQFDWFFWKLHHIVAKCEHEFHCQFVKCDHGFLL